MISVSHNKFTLKNGLDVILHEDHSTPFTAVNVWYHVGSKDEEVGRTGFAHLFEHVMFEGSKHHNHSYFEPLQKVGADLNGSTTSDRTNYWENIPSNYLELALWLEADRMGFLLDSLDQSRFDIQRDVVKNERRQSYENRPYGLVPMFLQPNVFPAPHPYNWMTIGVPDDLDAATLDDVKIFFRRFYSPSNASLAIAGDINPDQVQRMVELYFGELEPGPQINRIGRMDSGLKGSVSLSMFDKVQLPRIYLVWPTVPDFDDHQPSLDLLATILGDGKSSRLYRNLVHQKQIVRDVAVAHHPQEIAGEFIFQVTLNPGVDIEEVETLLWEGIDRVRNELVTGIELERAKNRFETYNVRQLERIGGFGGRADSLNYYNIYKNDPSYINEDIDRYRKVDVGDIKRVSRSIFGDNYVRLTVLPEEGRSTTIGLVDRSLLPSPSAAPTFVPPVPKDNILANGVRILSLYMPNLPMVSFGLVLQSGSVTDPIDCPGIADMTVKMLPEGTSSRSTLQIADAMEFLGGDLGLETGREVALLATSTLKANWESALDIISDIVLNPIFPDEEFNRIREERLTDLRRVGDSAISIASRVSRALLYGPDTKYGHPTAGTEASIQSMSIESLKNHFSTNYGPDKTTLIVVGDVTETEIIDKANSYFGSWIVGDAQLNNRDNTVEGQANKTTIFLADKPGAAQSVIRAGHLTVGRSHSDYFALTLMNYVFGGQFAGRLNMNLRQDKGYSYGYMSGIDWSRYASPFLAGGSVQTDVTKEAVEETIREFQDIKGRRQITEEEFQTARDGILRALPAQFETHEQIMGQLENLAVFDLPLDYFSHLEEKIKAVKLSDVHRVAKEKINDSGLNILVVGDRSSIEVGMKELNLPIVHIDYDGRPLQ